MFPIPFNFPFRKKDGAITTIDDAISSGGTPYTLPTASADTKGGVKVGSGLTMDGETLKNTNPTPYTLPTASAETKGGVKVGDGLSIDENGVLSASGGGGGGVSYVDVTINSPIGGGTFATAPFQPPTDLVGKRVINGVVLEGVTIGSVYLIGVSRMSDPVAAEDWIYALLYNYAGSSTSATVTKIRIFYT